MFEVLSIFFWQDRKIRISPACKRFDGDMFLSKAEQNRPTGTQDKCQSMESWIYQKIGDIL